MQDGGCGEQEVDVDYVVVSMLHNLALHKQSQDPENMIKGERNLASYDNILHSAATNLHPGT
jgi:hypothetical protein